MGMLRTIAAAHRHHQANEFAASLEARASQRTGDDVRQQGIARDDHVRSRYEHPDEAARPSEEEALEVVEIPRLQPREARQRGAHCAVEAGWDPPHASSTGPKLGLLGPGVHHPSVRGIGDDGADGVGGLALEPLQAVAMEQP
jgi:hypothetical protein